MRTSVLLLLLSSCVDDTKTPPAASPPAASPPAASRPAASPPADEPAPPSPDRARPAVLSTHTSETEDRVSTVVRITVDGKTHDAATATGSCRVEAGQAEVLQSAHCFYAGMGSDFELRKTEEGLSLWRMDSYEEFEEPGTWEVVWRP